MIVQSFGRDGQADFSFTVPRKTCRSKLDKCSRDWRKSSAARSKSMPECRESLRLGHRHAQPLGRGLRMFEALAEAKYQRRDDQHQRSPRERDRRRRAKAAVGLAALKAAFADVLG